MSDSARFTPETLVAAAASAVAKVDLLGPRGTTLCTMDEVEAMALLIAMSGILPGRPAPDRHHPMHFASKENT